MRLHGRKHYCAVIALAIIASCGNNSKNDNRCKEAGLDQTYNDVAPADIAMLISSMTDAINLHENVEEEVYQFKGVLTDGRGTPLYTDMHGRPGNWEVVVLSSSHVLIRNIELGDILPTDLRLYIASSLMLSDSDIVAYGNDGVDDATEIISYNVGEALLKFETRYEAASNGREGAWLSISVES